MKNLLIVLFSILPTISSAKNLICVLTITDTRSHKSYEQTSNKEFDDVSNVQDPLLIGVFGHQLTTKAWAEPPHDVWINAESKTTRMGTHGQDGKASFYFDNIKNQMSYYVKCHLEIGSENEAAKVQNSNYVNQAYCRHIDIEKNVYSVFSHNLNLERVCRESLEKCQSKSTAPNSCKILSRGWI